MEAINSVAKRLIIIRFLRSIGQGAMVVDLTLYLKDLHWSGGLIGSVTSVAGIVGAMLILAVGILSDKMGRKPFLLIYELLTFLAAIAVILTTNAVILIIAIVIAGFGRGQSGAAGPFSPAEQAWLARFVNHSNRGTVFSLNNAVGFFGMAIGAIIGGIPSLVKVTQPIIAYRPIFILVAIISLICVILIFGTKEELDKNTLLKSAMEYEKKNANASEGLRETDNQNKEHNFEELIIRKNENKAMLKLGLVNTLNGIAVGLTGPMMVYWFSIKYGVSTAAIGLTISISFVMTGIFSVFNGVLAKKVGIVKSITVMRVVGSGLMLLLPWIPTFTLASFIYVIRNAINRGTQGNRSALSASLTRDNRRGLATSINALSMRLPSSVGPTITGHLFELGFLSLPLLLTATLQLANAGLYQWLFGEYDKKREVIPQST